MIKACLYLSVFCTGMTMLVMLPACGSADNDDDESTTTATWTNTTAQAIVGDHCAVSGCHNGTVAPNFSGISQADFVANTTVQTRLNTSSTALVMPQTGSTAAASWTADDKTTLLSLFD